MKTVEVTEALIRECATARGGWTKRQLEALGVDWPPQKGWIERVVGTHINEFDLRALRADAQKFI
jgi:hypothetical protein